MEVLFYYCSNQTLLSIIRNRSIWLSSLSLSSDSMEGKLVAEVLTQIAEDDGLDKPSIEQLRTMVSGLEQIVDGLGFCLSEKGDLLSQWRGYADDAKGAVIGFSKEYLEQLSEASRDPHKSGFTLQKVEYNKEKQIERIKPAYIEIKKLIGKGAFRFPVKRTLFGIRGPEEIERENEQNKRALSDLSMTTLSLFSEMFLLKNSAFSEEHEWRLITYYVKNAAEICYFRALNNRIVPYREYSLTELETSSIVDIILGPKNITPNYVIENLLKLSGFNEVKLKRSKATYR